VEKRANGVVGFDWLRNKRPHPATQGSRLSVASINRRKCGRARSTIDVRRRTRASQERPCPHGPDLSRFVEIGERMGAVRR
jgi:hypothetical protein